MTTEPLVVLVVEDEYDCYFDQITHGTAKSPAVQWLETVFIGRWALGTFREENLVPGPQYIRPMVELIDRDYESAEFQHRQMTVRRSDYDDLGRWWL